jgi:hypothetical protein
MKNKILTIFIALILLLPLLANAGIISLGNGNVTSDSDSELIVDHLNQREYLRFDTFGPMTYQEQVNLTTTGAYADFSVADHLISFDFINALLDGNTGNCNIDSVNTGFCNLLADNSSWSDGDLGFSNDASYDYWIFKNRDLNSITDFGLAGIRSFGTVYSYSNWGGEASVNFFGNNLSTPIHVLLYRNIPTVPNLRNIVNVTKVPEPTSILLLILALSVLSIKKIRQ